MFARRAQTQAVMARRRRFQGTMDFTDGHGSAQRHPRGPWFPKTAPVAQATWN